MEISNGDFRTNWRVRWLKAGNDLTLYKKTTLTHNKWKFSGIHAFNLVTKTFNFNAAQISWAKGDDEVFLRVHTPKWEQFSFAGLFNSITLDYIRKYSEGNRIGLEVTKLVNIGQHQWK